ncbi:flagellar protein FlbD [Priestia megaterium]|nr:flagellar protein FlbD [Priestia megaterium]
MEVFVLLYLTKKTGEKQRFLLNHQLFEQAHETVNGTLITLRDGGLIIVEETLEEIIKLRQEYEAEILYLLEKKKEEGTCS